MDVFYLNLRSATARREAFVAQYNACNFAPHWVLRRFDAIDARHELVRGARGALSPGNKGCYFSSLECIRQSFDNDHHLFIVDDDIDFCAVTQRFVDNAIAATGEGDWDILLTDTVIPNAFDMPWITMLWYEHRQNHVVRMLDLNCATFSFCAGSTIINRNAKRKIHELMLVDEFTDPWDLRMREYIQAGRVRALLIFPFVTTVGLRGDESQIKPDDPDRLEQKLCNEFRRMMWVGEPAGPFVSEWSCQERRALITDEAVRMNAIVTPLLSLQMRQRWHQKSKG